MHSKRRRGAFGFGSGHAVEQAAWRGGLCNLAILLPDHQRLDQALAARTGVAGTGRVSVTITNKTGTDIVYVGNTGVSATTGQYIPAIAGASLTLDTTAALFCVVPTTTQVVTFVETY